MLKPAKKQGIGLLELMLSLAIIAILLIMATRYYVTTRTSQQVNEASEMVMSVYTAAESWLQDNTAGFGQDNMIPLFIGNGSLPAEFNQANVNPWGGTITTRQPATSAATALDVVLSNVPDEACNNLVAKFSQKIASSTPVCDPSKQEFSITLNFGAAS